MKLADDMKTCLKIHSIYNTPQRDNPSQMSLTKYAQMICADGFILENEKCLGNILGEHPQISSAEVGSEGNADEISGCSFRSFKWKQNM